MTDVLLLALALLSPTAPADRFDVQAELQGLYDEISQATLQFVTESDIDQCHEVLYTPDWVLVDLAGRTENWPQVRERAIQTLSAPLPDSMVQRIQKLSLEPDGVTVIVKVTTVRTVVGAEGRDGTQAASHALTETTAFRDRWVRTSDEWQLKSRQQISAPALSAGKTARPT